MFVRFTKMALPLLESDFSYLEQNGESLGSSLHIVKRTRLDSNPEWYSISDHTLSAQKSRAYFLAPLDRDIAPVQVAFEGQWNTFLNAISLHFLGVPHEEYLRTWKAYEGAPMTQLLQTDQWNLAVGAKGVKLMLAEFDNLSTDGSDTDFIRWAAQEHPGCDRVFRGIRDGLRQAAAVGGMMIIGGI